MPDTPNPNEDRWAPLEMSYVAGLVDGEGSIGVYPMKRAVLPVVSITVTMTDATTIMYLRDLFGMGGAYRIDRVCPGHKPRYTWCLRAKRAEVVLRALLPYLRLKRPQAECALAMRAIVKSKGRWDTATPEQWGAANDIVQRIKVLNRRGVA